MSRLEALKLLTKFYNKPIFVVQIGMCSPQVSNVSFEEALAEFDRCAKFRDSDYLEYTMIYVADYVEEKLKQQLNTALEVWDLGHYKFSTDDARQSKAKE